MCNGFFLHCRVHNHALQVFGLNGLNGHCRLDGGFEQQFQPFFSQVTAKACDLGGITGQAVLVVGHAAKKLPDDVLAPANHKFFVAEVKAVLEVEQAGHQADG